MSDNLAPTATPETMYDVSLFVVIRVCVKGVAAASQPEAIQKAEEDVSGALNQFFQVERPLALNGASIAELADGEPTLCSMVDEQGDEEHDRTRYYCSDGKTLLTERIDDAWRDRCPSCLALKTDELLKVQVKTVAG